MVNDVADYFAVSRLRVAALDIFCPRAFPDRYLLGSSLPLSSTMVLTGLLTVFYKNPVLLSRNKRVKNVKISRFLPANWYYHGDVSNKFRSIGSFL